MLICGLSWLRRRGIRPAAAADRAERAPRCNCRRVAHRSRLRAIPATSALRLSLPLVEPGARTIVEDNIGGPIQQQSGPAADFNRSNSKGECDTALLVTVHGEGPPMQEWRFGGADPLTRTV